MLRNNIAINLNPSLFNSFQFNITSKCPRNNSALPLLQINAQSNETIFIYLESNQLKFKSLKYNTSGVTIGNSQLKFFEINARNTFGLLKSTVERKKMKKYFDIQNDYNNVSIKSYTQIAHEEYKFSVWNENNSVILSDKIVLEITGRYTVVLFPHTLNSIKYLDYVVITDIKPNGCFIILLYYIIT